MMRIQDQFTNEDSLSGMFNTFVRLQEEANVGRQAPEGAFTSVELLQSWAKANAERVPVLDFDLDTYIWNRSVDPEFRTKQLPLYTASHGYPTAPLMLAPVWYVTIAAKPEWNSCSKKWLAPDFQLCYNPSHFHVSDDLDKQRAAEAPDNVPFFYSTGDNMDGRWVMDYKSLPSCGLNPLRHANNHFIFHDETMAQEYLRKATAEHKPNPMHEIMIGIVDDICDDMIYDDYDDVDFHDED